VLDEGAAEGDRQQLLAAADAEHGHVAGQSAAGDRDTLIKNLQEAGSSLKSGSVYEYLSARVQTGKPGSAAREAAPWLKLAEVTYKDPADQLRIALTQRLDRICEARPSASLVVHVDDISISTAGACTDSCLERLRRADRQLVQEVQEQLGLTFAAEKASVAATTRSMKADFSSRGPRSLRSLRSPAPPPRRCVSDMRYLFA
jgi:hypothetical protein